MDRDLLSLFRLARFGRGECVKKGLSGVLLTKVTSPSRSACTLTPHSDPRLLGCLDLPSQCVKTVEDSLPIQLQDG